MLPTIFISFGDIIKGFKSAYQYLTNKTFHC